MNLPKMYAQQVNKTDIDMTLSINPLGCSPRVLRAIPKLQPETLSQYPDPTKLIARLAKRFGVKPENVLLGNGSEQLIKLIAQTFLQKNDVVGIEFGSFGVFSREALLAGGKIRLATLEDLTRQKSKLVFIANPKTPTGERIKPQTIGAIQTASDLLVVDEANGEMVTDTSIPLAIRKDNVLVLRTLSKTFGLAGIRLGFVIGPKELINKLTDAQQVFPVSQIAIELTLAALDDDPFIQKTVSFIKNERTFLKKEIGKLGLTTSNSVTNNVFVMSPDAEKLIAELNNLGVGVINGTLFPGMKQSGFRISIKDKKTNRLFLAKLKESVARIQKNKNLLPSKMIFEKENI